MVTSYCASPFLKQCEDRTFKGERRRYGIVDKDGIPPRDIPQREPLFLERRAPVHLEGPFAPSGEFLCKQSRHLRPSKILFFPEVHQ